MKTYRYVEGIVTILDLLSLFLIGVSWVFGMFFFFLWVVNIFLCGFLASKMRRNSLLWGFGALFLPIIIPAILFFLKEIPSAVSYQALRVKPGSTVTKPIVINKFNVDKAVIKASFDISSFVSSLDGALVREFSKRGYQVVENGKDCVTIDGSFVLIDEGNRFVRYALGFAGNTIFDSAKIEVEGTIKEKGVKIQDFNFRDKGSAGFQAFGGSAEKILLNAAGKVAKKIANLVAAPKEG